MKSKLCYFMLLGLTMLVFNTAVVDAREMWETPRSPLISSQATYIAYSDYYQLRYFNPPENAAAARLNYWGPTTGDYYEKTVQGKPSRLFYINCNGYYRVEILDASGNTIAETRLHTMRKIQNLACESFPDASTEKNDLNLLPSPVKPNGNIDLVWTGVPEAEKYEIYKNGEKIHETTGKKYEVTEEGLYGVVGKDSSGNIVGESDYQSPSPFPYGDNGSGSNNNACADLICQCIQQLKPSLDQISNQTGILNDSVNGVNDSVQAVKDAVQAVNNTLKNEIKPVLDSVDSRLSDIRNLIYSIDQNLTIKRPHPLPSINDYTIPSLDDNKPIQRNETFIDTNIYFTDQGDAPEVPSIPIAPDREAWKDQDGNIMQIEDELQRQQPMQKDNVLNREPIIEREQTNKRTNQFERDTPLEVIKENYDLRWKSSDYIRE